MWTAGREYAENTNIGISIMSRILPTIPVHLLHRTLTAIYRESICKVCFPQRSAPPSSQTVTRQLTPDTPNVYKMQTAGSAIEVKVTANFDNDISTNRLRTQPPTPIHTIPPEVPTNKPYKTNIRQDILQIPLIAPHIG